MQGFFHDCRYALRQLRKTPGFTVVAVLSLALSIGATTAVFGIMYEAIIHPYPFRDWQRIALTAYIDQGGNSQCCLDLTGAQVQRLREAQSVEEILAYQEQDLGLTDGNLPENVHVIYWTPNAISYLGVPPALGRGFVLSDAAEGQDPQPVAMLGYRFWQSHFGGDPGVLGKTIEVAHQSYKIVGVLSSKIFWGTAEVLLPVKLTADPTTRLYADIRLKPGVTVDAATAELEPLFAEFAKETPLYFPVGFHLRMRLMVAGISKELGPPLYLLLGAVSVLLLIACLNVAMLLLARGAKRQYELAVRAAIGAAHRRLVRLLLTESLILAFFGEILGIGLAYALQRLLVSELPQFLRAREYLIYINIPVLLFSVGLVLVAVLVFGLVPALQSSRRQIGHTMQLQAQNITGGGRLSGNFFITAQVALTLVLLVAAVTGISAFLRLIHNNLGYNPKNAMVLHVPLQPNSYTTWQARAAYLDRLKEKIAAVPDVTAAGISTETVPPSTGMTTSLEIFGKNSLGNQEVDAGFVSQEYFDALQIPLRRGRLWSQTEIMTAAHLAVVNQALAQQYWPDGDAIGKQIRLPRLTVNPTEPGAPAGNDWAEIIGIVGDALNDGLQNPVKAAAYFPYTFHMPMAIDIMVRTRGNPLGLLQSFRIQAQTVNADQQIGGEDTQTLEDFVAEEDDWETEHVVAILFSGFAVITLLLAAAGLYSVVSYTVAQRTREFALRMALGAQRADVLLSVFLSTLKIVVLGFAAGLVLSLLLKGVVAHWAFTPPGGPLVFFLMAPLLIGVAMLAAFLPARRAMSVDPMKALRYE